MCERCWEQGHRCVCHLYELMDRYCYPGGPCLCGTCTDHAKAVGRQAGLIFRQREAEAEARSMRTMAIPGHVEDL